MLPRSTEKVQFRITSFPEKVFVRLFAEITIWPMLYSFHTFERYVS